MSRKPRRIPDPAPGTGRTFDVADLYRGPLVIEEDANVDPAAVALDEKLRQAYFWIVNSAIISPHYDIEYAFPPAFIGSGFAHSRSWSIL